MCDVWRGDDSDDSSRATITSSALPSNHSPANICIIQTFDPFLSLPAHGIQSVASFCHLTSREEFSQAILSLDTFNNFTRVSSEICKTKYISQSSDCVSITSHKDHNYNPVTGLWPQSESQYLKFFKIWRFILRSVSHILYPSTFKK